MKANNCLCVITIAMLVHVPVLADVSTQPAEEILRPVLSPEAQRDQAQQLIDRFVVHVQVSDMFADEAKRAVAEAWKKHRHDDEPQDFLVAGLAILSASFQQAMTALDAGDYDKADHLLAGLQTHGDPYLSLHARALAARSLVEQERLEEAEERLKPLADEENELIDKTFLESEVDFLLGYCQLANLRYEEAFATLDQFDRQHPNAPERFRMPAEQMLKELMIRESGGLGDVSDLMVYSGRRLANGHPAEAVQIRQKEAVELLARLIKQLEEYEKQGKCKSCGGKGCKKCGGGQAKGNQPGSEGARESTLPLGAGEIGDLKRSSRAQPGEVWGQMRPEERERILQALRRNFPARYRQLVEQYYRQLAKEE